MSPRRGTDLFSPLTLPCGVVLKNRLVKSAMSDSLGDGMGHPGDTQGRLYQRWAEGGVAVSIIGEVQGSPDVAEKPGNLVLRPDAEMDRFRALAAAGKANGAHLWVQLGHAGAMAHPPISAPKGPSALDLPGLTCAALTMDEIKRLPGDFADTAVLAQQAGFGGVQVHAAHGFLLSQFLSPLFNHRTDAHGGPIGNRMRLLLEVVDAVRAAVGPTFPIAVKLNATDQLDGGLEPRDALQVVTALTGTGIDLIDISGGTYFPGARSASDSAGAGAYFRDYARRARRLTDIPLMLTGGVKTHDEAQDLVSSGDVDAVGLARALVLQPGLPALWQQAQMPEPPFPRFDAPPEGGMTAWYTMRLTRIGEDRDGQPDLSMQDAIAAYDARDKARIALWNRHFRGG